MILWNRLRLKSKNPHARQRAVDSLERLASRGSSRAVELLVVCLGDKNEQVRRAAARVFNTISDERAMNSLTAAMADPDSDVRVAAAGALARQGDSRGIPSLVCALRDRKTRVRLRAAASLRKLGWKPTDDKEHALFQIALGNPKGAARAGKVAVEPLAAELTHDTSIFRRAVAEALEGIKDPRTIVPLLSTAKGDADISVQISAIYALANLDNEHVIPALEKGLRHENARVRLASAQVLARRENAAHRPHFLALLQDHHFEIRLTAVEFLAKLRDPETTEALIPMLQDPDHDVREAAAKALGAMRCTPALETLVLALIDEDLSVRRAAEHALAQINLNWASSEAAQRAKTRIQLSANDDRSWVRSAARQLLAMLSTPAGRECAPA